MTYVVYLIKVASAAGVWVLAASRIAELLGTGTVAYIAGLIGAGVLLVCAQMQIP